MGLEYPHRIGTAAHAFSHTLDRVGACRGGDVSFKRFSRPKGCPSCNRGTNPESRVYSKGRTSSRRAARGVWTSKVLRRFLLCRRGRDQLFLCSQMERCSGKPSSPSIWHSRRVLPNGCLRIVYAARIGHCRACPLRPQCQRSGKSSPLTATGQCYLPAPLS